MFKSNYQRILLLLLLLPIYFALYKLYIPKVNAFGCFDDCFNITAGFLVLKGKVLYSQIFFNHQMLMAYLSSGIQYATHPTNIYELILRHRQFVLLFGLLFNLLIVFRFKIAGFAFVIFYEFLKFYVFGDRFLAEGIIVYPLVYMSGLIFLKFKNQKIYNFEYLLSAFFAWFVLFMREPFAIVAIASYFLILYGKKYKQIKVISFVLFSLLTVILLHNTKIDAYFFNIFTVNANSVLKVESNSNNLLGTGILKSFLYPIYLFFGGEWNLFRQILLVINSVFIVSLFLHFRKYKNIKLILICLFILGLANLRIVPPGKIFYETFHITPWFGMFLIFTFLFLKDIARINKKMTFSLVFLLILSFGYLILSKESYIHDKKDPHFEFMTNYGNYLQTGEAVKALSGKNDTLFVDGFDELIIWSSDRLSPYKYSWYTSVMPLFPVYTDARIEMFNNNPPDFYYGSCPKDTNPFRLLPENVASKYQNLYKDGKPSCLYVKKSKIPNITKEQLQKAKEFLYTIPESNAVSI